MKKLLAVIVLGLLLSGNAYADGHDHSISFENQKKFIKNGTIKIGMHIDELNEIIAIKWYGKVSKEGSDFYLSKSGFKVHCDLVFQRSDIQWPQMGYCFNKKKILTQIWDDPISMTEHWLKKATHKKDRKKLNKLRARLLSTKPTVSTNTASSSSGSSSMSTDDKITQSKQICKDLGFKTNTEKFADCALQMMSIQFETTNKVSSASGGTTQEVIVTHRNDYDIWDALLDFSAAIDPKNKTTTSSSSSNRGTNCVVGRTNPTFGTTTINCN